MYLVSDDYGDHKEVMNYKQLKDLLVKEIIGDIKENKDDEDIVNDNLEHLRKLAIEENFNEVYIKAQLQSYGWYIQNIYRIRAAIESIREYYLRCSTDKSNIDFDYNKTFEEIDKILSNLK